VTHNRPITIYTANTRRDRILQQAPADVQTLFERLGQSQAIPFTHDAYTALKKAQQDKLKDVGAYIAGELKNGSRRNGCVLSRGAAVLDADNLPAGTTDDFIRRVTALEVCCCIHSTAKHSAATPRLRVVIPFAADIPAEEYSPVVRSLCRLIQPEMTWFDPTTAEPGRIMYYPAHCQDVEPVYIVHDGRGFLASDSVLQQLGDWKDSATWPRFPRETAPAQLAAKQQDPEAKEGLVGTFCRCYDVPAAMEKFLPGVYEPAGEGRYTFTGGSTYAGAVLYDNGKFLYSHHATDPCSGSLVNSWDLVRLHKFGALDDDAKDGARGNRLPSYAAMMDLAQSDTAVSELQARAVFDAAFKETPADEEAALALARCAGDVLSQNVLQVALNALGITVRRNMITHKVDISGMPAKYSQEYAHNTLPVILMDLLNSARMKGVTKAKILDYLGGVADESRYNPVLDMLHSTPWDGRRRFSDLLQMIHIAEDSFHALLLRKWLIQSVAMIHNTPQHIEPAEGVLTIQGAQGIGKTMLLRRLSIKSEWFSEGVTLDLKNKDDVIRAVGVWITELGELDSTLKKEQANLKAFITQKVDKIRAPYAAEAAEHPRRTSFSATVNPEQFLKDDTGDRRFWVIPLDSVNLDQLIDLQTEWFVQLWAEVYLWWQLDPQGFRLSPTERAHLEELNRGHREFLPGEEEILEAFNWDLPLDQWGTFTSTTLKNRVFFTNSRVTAQQVGRVLAKLTREDERITVIENTRSRVKSYRLPISTNWNPQSV